MSERPVVLATPLVTLGEPTAEVCIDGWCGPVDRLAEAGERQPSSDQTSVAEHDQEAERH